MWKLRNWGLSDGETAGQCRDPPHPADTTAGGPAGEDGLIITDAALYDKDLTVDGLYGSYTKIFCGEIGEAGEPFVFLLTQEGRVEYIDVLSCLSCGYFCGGLLMGVTNVKAFDLDDEPQFVPGIDVYYIDAYAVTAGGERLPPY